MELKDQILAARSSKGLSQDDLAEAIGVSRQSVIYWETGVNVPRPKRLGQIERVLGVKLDVTGTASMPGQIDGLPGLTRANIQLAFAISQLPRPKRDALRTLLDITAAKIQEGERTGDFFVVKKETDHNEPTKVLLGRLSAEANSGNLTACAGVALYRDGGVPAFFCLRFKFRLHSSIFSGSILSHCWVAQMVSAADS